jgi:hypothetical protein
MSFDRTQIRVFYAHGGGGHPLGAKPTYLRDTAQYGGVACVHMPHTTYYDECLRLQLQTLLEGRAAVPDRSSVKPRPADDLGSPSESDDQRYDNLKAHAEEDAAHARETFDIAVGSSFGSALLVDLVARGIWRGPALLLCPAVLPGVDNLEFAEQEDAQPVLVVRGTEDNVVRPEFAKALLEANEGRKPPVEYLELEGEDHDLGGLTARSLEDDAEDDVIPSLDALIRRVLQQSSSSPERNVDRGAAEKALAALPASAAKPGSANNTNRKRGKCTIS